MKYFIDKYSKEWFFFYDEIWNLRYQYYINPHCVRCKTQGEKCSICKAKCGKCGTKYCYKTEWHIDVFMCYSCYYFWMDHCYDWRVHSVYTISDGYCRLCNRDKPDNDYSPCCNYCHKDFFSFLYRKKFFNNVLKQKSIDIKFEFY
jgi:hypothetical protein